MKILVLGDSGSSGALTGGTSWTTVMRDLLAQGLGEEIELEQTAFVPTGERAAAFAAGKIAEHQPDLVVMPIGNYVFTAAFVWLRVQRVFGRRMARWFRSLEQSVNERTYEKGLLRQRLNRALRAIAQRVIGAETITTRQESAQVYDDTFRNLARSEHLQVIAVPGPRLRKMFRDLANAAELKSYMDAVRASAEAHHFLFVETAPAFAGREEDPRFMQSDGLHGTPAYHAVLGEYVTAVYLEHVGQPTGPGTPSQRTQVQQASSP